MGNPSFYFDTNEQLIFSLDCSVGAGCLDPYACNIDESATYNDGNLCNYASTEFIAFFSSTSYEFDDISYNQSTIIEQNFTSSFGCDSTIIISITIGEATTLIPDTIFEQELIDLGYDDVLDGSVATANINPVINLEVDDLGINDLTGIEAFTSLKTLECYDNNLTSLDVSNLIWLTDLDCDDNNLTSLDLTNCTSLQDLDCDDNNLTSLDLTNCTSLIEVDCDDNNLTSLEVSNLIWLTDLDCDDNNLTSLDLTNCTSLIDLGCDDNNLTSLDLTNCTSLQYLDCEVNNLTSLDVTNCTLLEFLDCEENNLTSLDLTNCTSLRVLDCYDNNLTSLDVTNCTSLTDLDCSYNNLTSLDVTNCTSLQDLYCTNNYLTSLDLTQSTNLEYVSTYNNPNLYCVSVPTLEDMSEPSNNNFDQPGMGGPGGTIEYSNIGSIQFSHDPLLIFSLDCSVGAGCLEPDACNTDESATYNDGNLCGYPSTDSLVVYNYTSYEWNGTNYSQSGLFEQNLISSFGCDSTVFIDLTILDSPFQLFPETFYTTDSTFQFSLLQEETISGPGVNDASFSPETAGLGTHTITSNFSKAIAISGGEYSIDTNATFGYIDISEVGIELSISNSDDDYSDYLALGFDFQYWGENVDSFQVVSNGWITFDDSQNDDYNIGLPVEYEEADNSIFLIDVDLDPSESDGTINYATIGEAPNRIFVLEFDSVAYFSNNDVPFSSQLHLYETSNRIEIHTATADNYANGKDASQGLQSPDQDVAFVVPGRDESKWVLIDDVVAFEFFNIYEFANAEISADVNVITIDTSFQDITACASFDWNGTTYSQNGTYTYETNSSLGYDSVAVLNLSINPNPEQLSISQRWSTTFQTGESFAYQWYLNGEEIEDATSDYCNFTQGGTYTVEAIDSLGCKTMSEEFVIGSLDRVFTSEMDFMLYPNPTNQFLNIELQEELGTEYIIVVSDLTGRALVNFDGSKNNTLRPFIDLNNLAKGSYQITVKYSNSIAISKTVIKN